MKGCSGPHPSSDLRASDKGETPADHGMHAGSAILGCSRALLRGGPALGTPSPNLLCVISERFEHLPARFGRLLKSESKY